MPKIKTKSAAKKRFSITGTGKLKSSQANKNHFRRRKTKKQIRNSRGTTILEGRQVNNTKKFFLPNA